MTTVRRRTLIDLAFATALGTGALLITAHFGEDWSPDDRAVDVYALTLVAVAFAALIFRRRWPIATLSVTSAATSAYLLGSFPYGPILVAFFIAIYTVASQLPLRTAAIAASVALLVVIAHVFVHPSAFGGLLGLIPGSAWAVVPFAIGTTVRVSREAAEAARAEAFRHQLYEERLRIAQEVHDIVGHGLAAIQMQADVALHVDEQQPRRTRAALESISRASSEAFEELRGALDMVRGHDPSAWGAVSPGVDDIEDLCDRMRRAGLDVELTLDGAFGPLRSEVALAVYRVVQEALTNVVRHGPLPSAAVHLTASEGSISIRVTNPGPAQTVEEGSGVRGMRRRVEALGGEISVGPSSDGFRVLATLPTGERH